MRLWLFQHIEYSDVLQAQSATVILLLLFPSRPAVKCALLHTVGSSVSLPPGLNPPSPLTRQPSKTTSNLAQLSNL